MDPHSPTSVPDEACLTSGQASRWRIRLMVVLLLAVGLPLGVTLVRLAPPGESSWYPQCPMRLATGYHCAGCGATRCVHALLCGDFRQALAYNALFVILLPLLFGVFANEVHRLWTGRSLFKFFLPMWFLVALGAVALGFGIVRNIDAEPFRQLAPHTLEAE